MTAIAGYWDFGRASSPADCCNEQLNAQSQLGEDPQIHVNRQLALGRRISRVLPEDQFDAGPVVTPDGQFALVADVRLDNRSELQEWLRLSSAALRAMSDATLLLRCWLQWQETALDRIVGDFAFALWDRRNQTLTLARDYIGQRPLHYVEHRQFFACASMPNGLHTLQHVPRKPSHAALAKYLLGQSSPAGGSFFEGISSVPPGHVLTVQQEHLALRKWWGADRLPKPPGQIDECVCKARRLLDEAVAARLRRSSGPVGSHLSAGLDSSAVSATAARLLANENGPLVCFTAKPADGNIDVPRGVIADESADAARVASAYPNIEHVFSSNRTSLMEVFERNVALWQRPIPNPLNDVWWSAITESSARRDISVLLSGPMGNIGLSHSGEELLPQLVTSLRLARLWRLLVDEHRATGQSIAKLAARATMHALPPTALGLMRRLRGQSSPNPFVTRDALALACEHGKRAAEYPADAWHARLRTIETVDPGCFNAGSMAGWRVDMRDPLADRRLVEFALAIPSAMFMDGGIPRGFARRVLTDRLPEIVVRQRQRGYQAADWYDKLMGERDALVAEAEAITNSSASHLVDGAAVASALKSLPQRRFSSLSARSLYGCHLVAALAAGHFIRKSCE